MNNTTTEHASAATRPPLAFPVHFVTTPDDAANDAEARLCATLGAMAAWADAHGDRGSRDRAALWRGYRLSHELMLAFCAVDGAAFGSGQ